MAWRFRKRAKIFPGVYLNFSKSGISTTIGPRGASINIGSDGAYLNTGIPGTGFYNRTKISDSSTGFGDSQENYKLPAIEEKGVIESSSLETLTSEGLSALKETLLEAYKEKKELSAEIKKAKQALKFSKILMIISYLLLIGFFIKWFKNNYVLKTEMLQELNQQFEQCVVNVDIDLPEDLNAKYQDIVDSFSKLLESRRIWDITSSVMTSVRDRTAAAASVIRKPVKFSFGNINIISSQFKAMHLQNANGGDLYIYPGFIVIINDMRAFGLIDFKDLKIEFAQQRFIEEESIPSDSKIVDYAWAKVNKNGTPDKRFKNNHQIPIALYGKIGLCSDTGLNEVYQVSNCELTEGFYNAARSYQTATKK